MHSKQTDTVVVDDGRVIDRTKVCFLPVPDKHEANVVHLHGATYQVEGGTFRRLGIKQTKQQRREEKRERGRERRRLASITR